jgi:hypothetical protein
MKFGIQFEYHKIPELDEGYLNYSELKKLLSKFKKTVKCKYIPYNSFPYSW